MTAGFKQIETTDVDLVREGIYRFLGLAFVDPRRFPDSKNRLSGHAPLLQQASQLLREEFSDHAHDLRLGELPIDELCADHLLSQLELDRNELAEACTRSFGLVSSKECPPYETEYYSEAEPFFRSQQMADVAGFYRAFGLRESEVMPQRPDHISLELEFLAFLLAKKRLAAETQLDQNLAEEQMAVCTEAFEKFFREHANWWMPGFAILLERKDPTGFYGRLARFLMAFLSNERALLGVSPSENQPQPRQMEDLDESEGCLVQIQT